MKSTKGQDFTLEWSDYTLELEKRTHVMGVLNVTPDSFADGGLHFQKDMAIEHGLTMEREGADIIDVGGESTRPYSEKVSAEDELNRVIPVIEALRRELLIPISIDTYKAEVARQALEAGASIINDISALRFDPEMIPLAAEAGVPVICMHMKGSPANMQDDPTYAIFGRVFEDADFAGTASDFDGGASDVGQPNVDVELYSSADVYLVSTATAAR